MNQQIKQSSPDLHHQRKTLSQAGQLSLENSKFEQKAIHQSKRQFQNKILQEVNNDDQFMQLPNITTTYLALPASHTSNLHENEGPKKQVPKKTFLVNQSEYDSVMSKIRQGSQSIMTNYSKKKNERAKFKMQVEQDLAGIEQIIGDIQKVMQESLSNSKAQPSFKKGTQIVHHSAKRQFQTKGINKFPEKDSLNKLEQMLLYYQMDEPNLSDKQPIQVTLKDTVMMRKVKNQERSKRSKQLNEITQSIIDVKAESKPMVSKLEESKKTTVTEQQGLRLEDIQVIEIDWFKLPIYLSHLSPEGVELLLKMKEFPDDQSFWIAINQSLSKQNQYKTYSIFNSQSQAGIKKSKNLMSEEQFREKWAEEWSYDIDEQQHKQLLCELDFQWYRSLVQATFTQNLEDILIKQIKYDCELYRKALKSINNGTTNDKNIKNTVVLPFLAMINKLKYLEALFNSLSQQKQTKSGRKALVIAAIPNIGQSQSKQIFQELKTNLQQIFVGGLYSSQSGGNSMGVIITKHQAISCSLKKWQGEIIQLGSVELLINQQNQGGEKNCICLSKARTKNSNIRLKVFRQGEDQGIDIEVGEQLHIGRRYHLLLN